jgi:hypothetical protein
VIVLAPETPNPYVSIAKPLEAAKISGAVTNFSQGLL